MEKINKLLKKWLFYEDSVYLPYKMMVNEFSDETERDAGQSKTLQKVYLDDDKLIIKFTMPKGGVFKANHHDCKEVINVVYGKIKWLERTMYYGTSDKITIPKDIKHSFVALEDTLAYAILYKPSEK